MARQSGVVGIDTVVTRSSTTGAKPARAAVHPIDFELRSPRKLRSTWISSRVLAAGSRPSPAPSPAQPITAYTAVATDDLIRAQPGRIATTGED